MNVCGFKHTLYLFLLVALFGCQNRGSDAELRIRIREDLGTLDWTYGEVNDEVITQIGEGLVVHNSKGEIQPGVAQRWELTDRTWTFHLNPNAKWSDGKPLCAEHFMLALKRLLKPGHSPFSHYFYPIEGAKEFNIGRSTSLPSVIAESCTVLKITTSRSYAPFLSLMTHWTAFPFREDLDFTRGPLVSNGPYTLLEWKREQFFQLSVNPHYHRKSPKISKVRFIVVPSDATALQLFETNQLDVVKDPPFLDRKRLTEMGMIKTFPSLVGFYIGFNLKAAPLSSLALRKALVHSVDTSKIPAILGGGVEPAQGWIPPILRKPLVSKGDGNIPFLKFDVKEAQSQLKKHGSVTQPLNLYYYAKDIHVPIMEFLQEQWRSHLGLQVRLHSVEGKVYWSEVVKKVYPIFLSGITAFTISAIPFFSEFLSDSHANWTYFNSKPFDASVQAATETQEQDAVSNHLANAESLVLSEQVAILPLYFRNTSLVVSKPWRDRVWVNPLTNFNIAQWN